MATINNLLSNVEVIRVANAASAAQTEVDGTAVDMAGKIGVTFVASFGTVTTASVITLKVEGSDDGSTGWTALSGSATHTADGTDANNKILAVDCVRPEYRYVRAVVTRTAANAVVDSVVAITYGQYWQPVEQGDTVLDSATLANAKAA
jgi:hypothetical protein